MVAAGRFASMRNAMQRRVAAAGSKEAHTPYVILRNTAAIGGASVIGDAFCQYLEKPNGSPFVLDTGRSYRMGIVAVFVVAPASFAWNIAAERSAPGPSIPAILKKLAIQISVMPIMIASQFAALSYLEGRSNAEIIEKLKVETPPTLAMGLAYWPLVGVLQYRFVNVLHRPVTGAFAGVWWNAFLSHQAHAELPFHALPEAGLGAPSGASGSAPSTQRAAEDHAAVARRRENLNKRRPTRFSM